MATEFWMDQESVVFCEKHRCLVADVSVERCAMWRMMDNYDHAHNEDECKISDGILWVDTLPEAG